MSETQLAPVLRHIRRLAGCRGGADPTDAQLLQRFVARRDEAAFTELVERHGRLVWGVCRQVLRHQQDAEDAFQAAFLVLARQAASVRKGEAVAGWLYRVAYRTATRMGARMSRARKQERQAVAGRPGDPHAELAWRELQEVLQEELARLPEKYRAPFVLCCLEGKSGAEAARSLGWKEGTVTGRLTVARQRLREALARRGVALPAALCGTALFFDGSGLPAALPAATARGAAAFAAGRAATTSGEAVDLARGVLKAMSATRLKLGAALVAGLALLTAGAGLAAHRPEAPPLAQSAPDGGPKEAGKPQPPKEPVDAHGDPLPPGALARLGTVRFRSGDAGHFFAFSPDGNRLALGPTDLDHNAVRLCDPATGREVRVLRGERPDWFSCLAFSPDGKALAAAGYTWDERGRRISLVALWDPATGKLRTRWLGRQDKEMIRCLAFSPDGKTVATGGMEVFKAAAPQPVRLWDVATGKEIRRLDGHQGAIGALAFSGDGKTLASVRWAHTFPVKPNSVRLWEVATGKESRRLEGLGGPVQALAVAPVGRTLATGGDGGVVRLWDLDTGKERRQIPGHKGPVRALAFSPDGKTLAVGADSSYGGPALRLWDAAAGKELPRLPEQPFHVEALAFTPDGKRLAASGYRDHTIHLWDLQTRRALHTAGAHRAPVSLVHFAPDGRILTWSDREGALRVWDRAACRQVGLLRADLGVILSPALSPDGRVLAVARADRVIVLLDRITGKELGRLRGHTGHVRGIVFSPDGMRLASGGDDKTVRLWDVAGLKEVRRLTHEDYFHMLVFSRDGRALGWSGINGNVRIWETATGKETFKIDRVGRSLDAIAFSPDGKLLAEGFRGGWIEVVELASGKKLHELPGRRPDEGLSISGPCHLAFSPDGKTLVAGGWDGRVRLWEVATGRERHRFAGHPANVQCIAFSPDGGTLASGGADTTVLLWDLTGRAGVREEGSLTKEQLEALWADLAGEDAARAYRAMRALAASARQSVPFLRDRLPPVPTPDPKRLPGLLSDLASARFAVRQKAMAELTRLGEAAEPALRGRLEETRNLEARQRVEQLLRKLGGAERLRQARALELLERAGTPEAVRLLESLAGGLPDAPRTRDAAAALERLKGQAGGR
jgi:RNA polymerase sigma factor (sigma-70 family)